MKFLQILLIAIVATLALLLQSVKAMPIPELEAKPLLLVKLDAEPPMDARDEATAITLKAELPSDLQAENINPELDAPLIPVAGREAFGNLDDLVPDAPVDPMST
ncbi:maker407 [Drosophila busckii]|uniref:Maker407 n=1 Tax=Drosophila busckii TaxID=30019 RepID=A0A0M4E894_DROBS|nr:uncharacterized protein LOC108605696 [Drosophila busckii]ALC38188.1 maker407 [Drosophila busckii]